MQILSGRNCIGEKVLIDTWLQLQQVPAVLRNIAATALHINIHVVVSIDAVSGNNYTFRWHNTRGYWNAKTII